MLGSLVVGKIVQQDGAENGTFGFHVGRKTVRETVVSSCQGSLSAGKFISKRDRDSNPEALVDARAVSSENASQTYFFRSHSCSAMRTVWLLVWRKKPNNQEQFSH